MSPFHLSSPLAAGTLLVGSSGSGSGFTLAKVEDLQAEAHFHPLLLALPQLLQQEGAAIVRLAYGSEWVVGVGSTPVWPGTGVELLRRRLVARLRAEAALAARLEGEQIQVRRFLTRTDSAVAGTRGWNEVLDETKVRSASGLVKEMPTLATWYSPGRQTFFLVLGRRGQ